MDLAGSYAVTKNAKNVLAARLRRAIGPSFGVTKMNLRLGIFLENRVKNVFLIAINALICSMRAYIMLPTVSGAHIVPVENCAATKTARSA